jgi:hypothetical protein
MGTGAADATRGASRGKYAMTVPAPATKSSASTNATGLDKSARRSRGARRGSVVIGKVVAPPDTMNTPITATYVIAQSRQNVRSWKYEAQPR